MWFPKRQKWMGTQNATDSYCFDENEKDAILQEPLLTPIRRSISRITEALTTCGEMLREAVPDSIWKGQPWRLWATDPDGKTVFALTLHATDE
jgi:hypothetical protein